MKVSITRFDIEKSIKNKGIQIDVRTPDGEDRLGDLTVTNTRLIWCKGKKHTKNGKKKTWDELIAWMEA